MTIPEAVSLILQAGAVGVGGEIFALDMGRPVLITDLAEQMIRLSGLEPGRDIQIVYSGLRPGEKLSEEILHAGEGLKPTSHEKLLLARSREVAWPELLAHLDTLHEMARKRDLGALLRCLQEIVPEFNPASNGKDVQAR